MTLPVKEFIRRFLYHILPDGYHRIRNYGFLPNGKKKQNIEIINNQLPNIEPAEITIEEEGMICPVCENGKRMVLKFDLAVIRNVYADSS